jgi:hypothetical protein
LKLFRKIKVTDRELSQVQDNVAQILQPLSKNALLDGTFVTVDLTSGSNTIAHRLQRLPLGWVITDRDTAATVYRTAWDSANIFLTASGTVSVTLYVY